MEPIPGAEYDSDRDRTSRSAMQQVGFVLLYTLAVLAIVTLHVLRPLEVFLLAVMIVPVLYAAFRFQRRVYLLMIVLAALVKIAAQLLFQPAEPGAWVVLAALVPVALASEMIYGLARQRERAERELIENQARYRLFVTHFQGVACQCDLEGNPIFLHGAIEDQTGYTAEDFIERRVNWFDLILAEDLPAVAQQQDLLRTRPNYFAEMDYRIRRRDGQVRWVRELAQNESGPDGKLRSILTALYDVTRTHQAEKALRESEQRFRGVFDNMQEGFALYQAVRAEDGSIQDFVILECNAAFMRTFNLSTGPLVGKTISEVFPKLGEEWWQAFRAVTLSGQPTHMEGYTRRLNRHLEVSLFQPAPEQVVTVTMDITRRKLMEQELVETQARFRSLFENSPIPLWDEDFSRVHRLIADLRAEGITDFRAYLQDNRPAWERFARALIVNDVNRAAVEMANMPSKEALLANISGVLMTGHPDGMIEQVCAIAEGRTHLQWEGPNDERNGEVRFHRITWSVAPGSEETYSRVIVAIMDITDSKRAMESLIYLSTHDTLTGLYNRAYFDTEIQRLSVGRTFPVSIVFADMDGLKASNDTLGHHVGDELLRRAALVLRSAFRGEDVVARIGGDEFGVLLPSASPEVAQAAVERVKIALQEHNAAHPGPPVHFSMGIATAAKDDNLEETLRAADVDMYRVKAEKRRMV